METDIITTQPSAIVPVSTRDVLDQFAAFLRLNVAQGDASQHTLRAYLSNLRQFIAWCRDENLDPSEAEDQDLVTYRYYLAQSGYKRSTIGVKLSAVRRFYEAAIWHGLREDNPAAGLKPPREHTSRRDRILERYLDRGEVDKLLTTPSWTPAGIRDRFILFLMYYHGLRVSEVAALCTGDISAGHLLVRAGKGRKDRAIVMVEPTLKILNRWLAERNAVAKNTDAMFVGFSPNGRGSALTPAGVRHIINQHLQVAGLKRAGLSCHALRHAHASHAVEAGVDLNALSKEMGHASVDTTGVYLHVVDAAKQNPAAFLVRQNTKVVGR